MSDQAAAQLRDELDALTTRIGAVLGTDMQLMLTERARDRAAWLAAELDSGEHPDETAADLLALLWPDDPPLDWWRTPLGLLIAPTAAQEADAPGWKQAEVAAVLGVSVGTVAQLGHRGGLDRATDGRFSRRSVLTRLIRLASQRSASSA